MAWAEDGGDGGKELSATGAFLFPLRAPLEFVCNF